MATVKPTILSKQNDVIGTDKYRVNTAGVPNGFKPRIDMSCMPNPRGTSNTMTVRSEAPIVQEVDGVQTSSDMFLMTTKFTSLQHVTSDALRAEIFDNHLAFLQAAREDILQGRLPLNAYVFTN